MKQTKAKTGRIIQKQEKIVVRLPEGMRDMIARAAKHNERSSNAEVVFRLKESFDAEAENAKLAQKVENLQESIDLLIKQLGSR